MIKLVDDDNFLAFLNLYIHMHKEINPNAKESSIISRLSYEMKQEDFFIFGDFKDCVLVGFICGFKENSTTWFTSGMSHTMPIRLVKLIKSSEEFLAIRGYTHWTTEYSKKDDKCIAPKLGAIIETIKYKKEI